MRFKIFRYLTDVNTSNMFAIATIRKNVNKNLKYKCDVNVTYMYVNTYGDAVEFTGLYQSAKDEIDNLSDQVKLWCKDKNYRVTKY